MVSQPIRQGMQSTNEWFAREVVAKGNVAALQRIYTKDARILPPGADMIRGRSAIQDFWGTVFESMGLKRAVLSTVEATAEGDGILEIGKAELTLEPAGQPASQVTVKYVVFWKQEDGHWKWHIDIWNPNA